MSLPVSVKKKDAGRIPGPANCASVIEIAAKLAIPNGKVSHFFLHGFYATPPANMQTLANSLFTSLSGAWSTNLGTFMHTTTIFQSVAVRDMTSFLNPISISTGTAVAGTSTTVIAMPPSSAIVMTENVNVRGKGLKGRVFLQGWALNADAGQGLIATGAQTAVNNFGTAVASAISAQSLTPCVAQVARTAYIGLTGTSHPARGMGHPTVTSYICQDLVWDTQRRRGQL